MLIGHSSYLYTAVSGAYGVCSWCGEGTYTLVEAAAWACGRSAIPLCTTCRDKLAPEVIAVLASILEEDK